MTQKKSNKGLIVYLSIAAVIILSLVMVFSLSNSQKTSTSYSQIIGYFDNLEVNEYTFDLGTGELKFKLNEAGQKRYDENVKLNAEKAYKDAKDKDEKITAYVEANSYDKIVKKETDYLTYSIPNVSLFLDDVEAYGNDGQTYREKYNEANPDATLEYDYYPIQDRSWLMNLIPTLLLLGVMVAFWFFMMKQAGGGGKMSSFGKANVKNQAQNGKKTTFDDVAGADEEKAEMAEIVDFLKNPKKYAEIGARIPKGVLLLGPPGTGKTLLARAVAGEAGCPFFSISGSDFVEMFVGVGASRVRDLFEQAKKNAPSIIFIDEIDAVGRHRGAGLGGGHDEREQTLNQLLVEMDGFTGTDSVIVIAATNRRDILDPALLRPGRFDRQIVVGYPDVKGRENILKVHTKNKPLGPDVDLSVIAKTTVGFTGADLENLVNEASLLAARQNRKAITKVDIEEATIKVIAGPEKKSRVVNDKEKRLTAYHEGGHAICTYFCETQDKVHQVSIIPRGMAGGYTMSLPEHDKSYVSKREMKENIITLLGGRVAEKIILDDISTGASNDIERATSIARNMVTRYGFSDKLGPMVYGNEQGEVFLGRDFNSSRNYSENVAAEIDAEMREIIEEAYEKAKDILEAHLPQLHFIAKYLIKFEKIDGVDFEKLMKGEIGEEIFENVKSDPSDGLGEILDTIVDDNTNDTSSNDENSGEVPH